MRIMKTISILIVLGLTIGCATSPKSTRIMAGQLEATIIDAAQKAKNAGAKQLKVELSLVSGYQANLSAPILLVNLGGGGNVQNTTKMTATIDLLTWKSPAITGAAGIGEKALGLGGDYFILDMKTFKLESIPAPSDR